MMSNNEEVTMIAETIVQFDDVLALAYRLTPLEKIKLVKQMADALEQEPVLTTKTSMNAASTDVQTWGAQVLAMLDTFETNDWQTIDMPDVVEWVKQQRLEQDKRRAILWDSIE
jgi:hypothetical protein